MPDKLTPRAQEYVIDNEKLGHAGNDFNPHAMTVPD